MPKGYEVEDYRGYLNDKYGAPWGSEGHPQTPIYMPPSPYEPPGYIQNPDGYGKIPDPDYEVPDMRLTPPPPGGFEEYLRKWKSPTPPRPDDFRRKFEEAAHQRQTPLGAYGRQFPRPPGSGREAGWNKVDPSSQRMLDPSTLPPPQTQRMLDPSTLPPGHPKRPKKDQKPQPAPIWKKSGRSKPYEQQMPYGTGPGQSGTPWGEKPFPRLRMKTYDPVEGQALQDEHDEFYKNRANRPR